MGRPRAPRLLAAAVLAAASSGLALQFAATYGRLGAVAGAIWVLLRYFTILSNVLAAVASLGIVARGPRAAPPALWGGLTLVLLLVAIVYHLLLRGLVAQTATERAADLFLHGVTPALVLLFWLIATARGGLRYRDVAAWAALPVLYLAYALARGAADGVYPYPFLDGTRIGWAAVARNAGGIAAGFVGAGFGLVWFDRLLGGRAR